MTNCRALTLCAGLAACSSCFAGAVESFWIGTTDGVWSTSSRWTAPGAPGIGPRTNQTAVIDAVGAAYAIQAGSGISLAGLRLESSDATLNLSGSGFEVRGSALINGGTIRTASPNGQAIFNDLVLDAGLLDFALGSAIFNGQALIRDELRIGGNNISGDGSLRFESGARFVGLTDILGEALLDLDAVIAGDMVIEHGVYFRRSLAFENGAIARLRGSRLILPSTTVNLLAESGFNSLRGPSSAQPAVIDGQLHVNSGATAALLLGFTSSLDITADAGSVLRLGQSNTIDNRFVGGSISSNGEIFLRGRNVFSIPLEGDFSIRITGQTEFHADQTLSRVLELTDNIVSFGELRFRDSSVENVQAALIGDQTQPDPTLHYSTVIESSASLRGSRLTLLNRTLTNSGHLEFSAFVESNSLFINGPEGALVARSLRGAASVLRPEYLNFGSLHLTDMGQSSMSGSVLNLTNHASVTIGAGQRSLFGIQQHGSLHALAGSDVYFGDAILHPGSTTILEGDGGLVRLSSEDAGTITYGTFHIAGDLVTSEKGQLTYRGGDFRVDGVVRLGGQRDLNTFTPTTVENFVAEADIDLERTELRRGGGVLGAGTVRFTESLDWHGGLLDGSGRRVIASGATAIVGREGTPAYLRANLENEGEISLVNLRSFAPTTWTITNAATGNIVSGADTVRVSVSGGGSTRRLEIHNHGEMDLSGANEVHLGGDFPSNSTVYVRNEGNLEFGVGTIRADAIDNLASLHLMGGSLTVLQRLRLLAGSDFIGHGTLALENSSSGTHILHDNFAQFSGEIRAVGNTHFQAGLDTDASLALVSNLTQFDKDVAVRGDVSVESGTKSFSSNSTFSGAFDLLGGSVLTSGTMRLDGPSSISGGSIGGSGNLVVTDLLAIDGGALSGNGSLIVEQTGNTSIGGDSAMTIARTIQNDGMIDVHGTGIVHVTRTVVNAGSLQVFGSGLFDGGGSNTGHVSIEAGALLRLGGDWSFAASSTVDARGVLELLGGHFTFEGDNVLSVANSLVITEDASVRVSGLNSLGHVISDGELFFLDYVAQVFDGFEQSLTGALTLASSIDGDSASLDVGGQVNLDGALILDFQNTPRGLEVIELHIIEAASVNGAFSSVNAVGLPKGFAIDLEYSATSVTAFVTVPSPTSMVMLLIGAATTSRRRRST